MKEISTGVALILVCALGACAAPSSQPGNGPEIAVAVLPFEVQGQEEGADDVGRAFAESIAVRLARSEDLRLLESPELDGATRLIRGTLTREGEAVHVAAQVRDAADAAPTWETVVRSYEGDLSGLAALVAKRIVRAMEVSYPDLYDYIGNVTGGPEMSGSPLAARTHDALRRGDLEEFLQASSDLVDEYGDDPAAHVLNGWALLLRWDAVPSNETLTLLGERLTALDRVDPSSPYDDLLRGYVYRTSGAPDQAVEVYSQVLAREDHSNAGRAWALRQRSYAYLQLGDAAAALRDAEEAVDLDPANALSLIALSKALEALGKLDGAIASSKQALMLEPFRWRHHQRVGLAYSRAGRFDEAVTSLGHACQLGESQEACANHGVALHLAGRPEEARAAAEYAESLVGTRWGFYNLACVRALDGNRAMALAALRRALDLGFADAIINTDRDFDSLRGDPEFEKIVADVAERIRLRRSISGSVFPWQA